jgi:hypothetical protein
LTRQPLPRVPPVIPDELFSSWFYRVARANFCTGQELRDYLGLRRIPEVANEIEDPELSELLQCLRLSQTRYQNMLLVNNPVFPIASVAKDDFQCCPNCQRVQANVTLRHWRYAWSIECGVCGARLRPQGGSMVSCDKLTVRARTGADFLALAYQDESGRCGRRVQSAVRFADASFLRKQHGTLIGNCQQNRYELLAAIGASKSKPLIKAAIVLRKTWRPERVLREAFPHRKKAISQVVKLRGLLIQRLPDQFQKGFENCSGSSKMLLNKASNPYYIAASKAIEDLGQNASRRQLLKYADRVLANSKQSDLA